MPIAPPPPPAVQPGAPLRIDEGAWPPAVGPPAGDPPPGDASAAIARRRCGRCLAMFPGDPALDPFALPEWWLCPPCRLALLGQESHGRSTATGAHRGR